MKIIFEKVIIKNFLSFGNNPIEFEYDNGINIVTGRNLDNGSRNGVGKSSLLVDSISFAIYGKPLRGEHINKDELVNEINKKGCEVSVHFSIGSDQYVVTRAIKPTSFTVFVNEEEKRFDSIKNTERWLEEKIGISHTCFSNILVLNMNDTMPFLTMDAAGKREVIEDVLNLKVFGRLADVAKDKHLVAKGDLRTFESELKSAKETFELAESSHTNLKKEKEKFDTEKQNNINSIRASIEILNKEKKELEKQLENIDFDLEIKSVMGKMEQARSIISKSKEDLAVVNKNIRDYEATLSALEHAPHCPTCHVPSDNPILQKYVLETKDNFTKSKEEKNSLIDKIQKAESIYKVFIEKKENFEERKEIQNNLKSNIQIVDGSISSKEESLRIEESREFTANQIITEDDLLKYKNKFNEVSEIVESASKTFNYNMVLRKVLGEEGVRKFILSKIIPFFNTKINQYLKIMGSDLTIVFNTNLDANILTRNREERSYGSFSAGEKKRIDISVLMSLMDLAKLQNSVDTNILVLDEVLDTAMDNEGIENFLTYLKDGFKLMYPDKAVYIITHRNTLSDDFYDKMIMLQKKDGFTTIDSIIDLRKATT